MSCDTCPTTFVTPRAEIEYILKATTAKGCSSFDSLHISIVCNASGIQIPSAFTPNNDGLNDRFAIQGKGIKLVQHFAVFDRYGAMLFETSNADVNDLSASWDGMHNGKYMLAGTYVFIADLICDTGEHFRYKGTVVLIR